LPAQLGVLVVVHNLCMRRRDSPRQMLLDHRIHDSHHHGEVHGESQKAYEEVVPV
jgi:hypothetical protein